MKEVHPELIEYILRNGVQYTPALLPADLERGKTGDCFDHCLMLTMKNRTKYGYVEGIAADPQMGRWILHAWLTDGELAFDPTWKAVAKNGEEVPVPMIYFGIPMQIEAAAKFVLETHYKSILGNGWRDPELANKALPTEYPRAILET